MKLFKVEDIDKTSMKAMEIEEMSRPKKDKKGKKHVNITLKKNIAINVTFTDIQNISIGNFIPSCMLRGGSQKMMISRNKEDGP